MLKVERLFAGYGEIQVLKDISFTVEKGKVISIVGANCAGKSTLLNTISGLLKPASGRIFLEGEEITRTPGHQIVQKGIVQVPEGRKLFPAMNVRDNLLIGASFPRAKKERVSDWEAPELTQPAPPAAPCRRAAVRRRTRARHRGA